MKKILITMLTIIGLLLLSGCANAGKDQIANVGDTVTLDGSASRAKNGWTILEYEWKQVEGEHVQLKNKNSSIATFVAPKIGKKKQIKLVFSLTTKEKSSVGIIRYFEDKTTVTIEVSPKVALILTGKAASNFATNKNQVLVAGYVYSNVDIDKVTCLNNRTLQEITATGTSKWDANITLEKGDNEIECTAQLTDSQTVSKKTVNITYYPNSHFTSLLNFQEDTFFVDETKVIKTTIGIDYNISKSIMVKLYEADQNGSLISNINFEMYDNGTLPDEIDKDGIFTVHATLNEPNPINHCYRVGVVYDNQNEFFSEVKCVKIIKHITQEQMQNFMSIGEDIKKIYAENNDTKVAAQKAYDALVNDPRIGAVGINEDGEGLWYVSVDGIAGAYTVFKEGKKAAPKEEVRSKKGLIISPFISNPNGNSWKNGISDDDYSRVWKEIKNKKSCRLKATTEKINNGSVSIQIDDFKHLSDYGYIHISTHGDNWFEGLIESWDDEWGDDIWLDSISEVVLFTGNKITKDSNGTWVYSAYEKDIATHRVVIYGTTGLLAITPAFIDRYVSSLPNSIVVLSACRSAINSSMANAFMSKGAKTVLGYTDYVYTSYSQDTTSTFMEELFNDKTTLEAFNEAIKKHGADDGDGAKFTLFGSQNLKLASGKLLNLDFEEGTLKPWKSIGDGRLIAQLGSSSPTEGQYMGIISTGLGYTTQAGSIEQTGCLDSNESILSFDWNFFSEEFKEYCNSQFQDTFKVVICETQDNNGTISKTNCSTLFMKTIDDLCGSVSKVTNKFDQGDVYATGWQTQDIDISSYVGKSVSLQFYSTDVGDSIYDSAILIDNIKFK